MKRKIKTAFLVSSLAALLLAGPLQAAQVVSVEVTNMTNATYFTPLLVTAHGYKTDLFEPGTPASDSLRLMAECGDISALLGDLGGVDKDTVADPAGGVLAPGAKATATLNITATRNSFLSIVGMLLPTNDGFVGLDSLWIPRVPGVYTYYLYGYDAGTEANSELLDTSGCVPGMPGIPGDPSGLAGTGGTGVADADANQSVHIHRGTIGDMDPLGGPSDLDSTAHHWLNPVAKLVITVTPDAVK